MICYVKRKRIRKKIADKKIWVAAKKISSLEDEKFVVHRCDRASRAGSKAHGCSELEGTGDEEVTEGVEFEDPGVRDVIGGLIDR